jgi:N-ethylmaleimide reductase
MTGKLLQPIRLGAWELQTRTAMAPMTRCFANVDTGAVDTNIADYYRRRAADGIGLLISEGTIISPRAKGYQGVPGLYTLEQIEAWKKVTQAVHDEGGTIIAQIWHVGRISHSSLTGGILPESASAIQPNGLLSRLRVPYEIPEAMSITDIEKVVGQYRQAAENAMEAGFDGVEIHGAHGYLIDQFNSDISNERSDRYGGDLGQRLTFMKEVLQSVIGSIGADRTLIRFSALKVDQPEYMWEDPEQAIRTFINAFKETGVKMIHPSTMDFTKILADGKTMHQLVRKYWDGPIVGVGNLDPNTAESALQAGDIDVAAFGRPLLSNPDFLARVKNGEPLAEYIAKQHLKVLV